MKKEEEGKSNNKLNNSKEELKLIAENDIIDSDNCILNNELLCSLFKKPPIFEKKYENEELNKFKDEILIYLSERNKHYMSIIKTFQEKIQENQQVYIEQMKSINQNYESILTSQALLNNKIDKYSNFELFINKTNDQLITHEIRINNLSQDFIKSTQKYDKIYLDNLELPGYIGKFAKFKNCQAFFENIIREIDKTNLYKEKNNLDIKAYKEKINCIMKSVHLLVKNNNEAQMKYIKQLSEKNLKECKDINDVLSNRICDLRIENAKYSMDLVKKNDEMNREYKKIMEIKDNLIELVNEKINNFKNIFNNNVISFNNFKKNFEELQMKVNELEAYNKEKKIIELFNNNNNNNNNNNGNVNNISCNNTTGCYISNALGLDKRNNWKNFPKKFAKRSKTKNKYLEKKQFLKSISSFNSNKTSENNNNGKSINYNLDNEIKSSNIIKIDDNDIKLNKESKDYKDNKEKEKETKKRITYNSNSVNREKLMNYLEKNKTNYENQSRRNTLKEPRSSKNVAKIEINSQDKIHIIEPNKKEEIRINNILPNKSIDEKTANSTINNNINTNNNNNETNKKILSNEVSKNLHSFKKYGEKEKDNALIHKYNKKSRKTFLLSNKSSKSDDYDSISISNLNLGNSNTLNSTNDYNYSVNTGNSLYNVNKFVLNDGLLDINDRVIKELASELEQSTTKKDRFASNKKKIEDNFNKICGKISPLNLNKIDEQKEKQFTSSRSVNEKELVQNKEDINNNINVGENVKINTVSTEKTDDYKAPGINNSNNNNNNNICNININQNDDNSISKKMDLFDKKLLDLESLLKGKIVEVLYQVDNLQNIIYYSLNHKSHGSKKPNNSINNISNSMSNNTNGNINIIDHNDLMSNTKTYSSHDDYFIHSHSVKKFAPIIEIDPIKLQFSPSPSKSLLGNKKIKEQNRNKGFKYEFTNNFKEIKLIRKNDNKENINSNNNNIIDNFNLTQFRLLSKNGIGVNKWIHINKLLNFEPKNSIPSSSGELLAKFDNN